MGNIEREEWHLVNQSDGLLGASSLSDDQTNMVDAGQCPELDHQVKSSMPRGNDIQYRNVELTGIDIPGSRFPRHDCT